MNFLKKYLAYITLIIGVVIAFYANSDSVNNQTLLILGIALMMLGLYRIAATIPHKKDNPDDRDDNTSP